MYSYINLVLRNVIHLFCDSFLCAFSCFSFSFGGAFLFWFLIWDSFVRSFVRSFILSVRQFNSSLCFLLLCTCISRCFCYRLLISVSRFLCRLILSIFSQRAISFIQYLLPIIDLNLVGIHLLLANIDGQNDLIFVLVMHVYAPTNGRLTAVMVVK